MLRARQGVSIGPTSPELVIGPLFGMRIQRTDSSPDDLVVAWSSEGGQRLDELRVSRSETGWLDFPGGVQRAAIRPAGTETLSFDLWWAGACGDFAGTGPQVPRFLTRRIASYAAGTTFAAAHLELDAFGTLSAGLYGLPALSAPPVWARGVDVYAATAGAAPAGPGLLNWQAWILDVMANGDPAMLVNGQPIVWPGTLPQPTIRRLLSLGTSGALSLGPGPAAYDYSPSAPLASRVRLELVAGGGADVVTLGRLELFARYWGTT